MRISFSPLRCDAALSVSKLGDVLTINGEAFDFSVIGEGDELPEAALEGTEFVEGVTTRIDGHVHITLRLPYRRAAGHVDRPAPLVNPPDGVLVLPDLNGTVDEVTENAD